jgi:Tol biopolymer transport system component
MEQAVGPSQLWRVPYPQGNPSRITYDTADYKTVSISRDGNTIVSIQSLQEGQISVAPGGDAQRARAIASTVDRVYGLDWNSKGRILFSSMSGNNLVISSIEPDGSNPIQLTANDSDNYMPATSPDGRFVVFASYRTGTLNIWRMNAADGSELKQLTSSDGNSYPSFSPDGQWVLYDNQSSTTFTVWKVPIEGGPPVQLTNEYTRMPAVSPDGQFIAARYLVEGGSREIAIFPFNGGAPIERLPIPVTDWQKVQWMPEGRALTYIDTSKGVDNIWRYDLGTRSSRQLTNFKTDRIFAYAWSPDFKSIACLRGTESRDVTVINNQP